MAHNSRLLGALLTLGVLFGCTHERADLEAALAPPVASRFLAHGNCFAGWFINVDVIVRETRGVDVALESVSLRVEDRTGDLLGEQTVEADALRERFGALGAMVPAHGSLRIPMSVGPLPGSANAPTFTGAIVASGEIVAADEAGRVRSQYRIPADVAVDGSPLPTGGACTPGSS